MHTLHIVKLLAKCNTHCTLYSAFWRLPLAHWVSAFNFGSQPLWLHSALSNNIALDLSFCAYCWCVLWCNVTSAIAFCSLPVHSPVLQKCAVMSTIQRGIFWGSDGSLISAMQWNKICLLQYFSLYCVASQSTAMQQEIWCWAAERPNLPPSNWNCFFKLELFLQIGTVS